MTVASKKKAVHPGTLVFISNIPAQSTIWTRIFYTVVNVCAIEKTEIMSSLKLMLIQNTRHQKSIFVRFNVVSQVRFASIMNQKDY